MSAITNLDSASGLVAFVTTVEVGGFAAASRQLGVSASAVGKAVGRLEARLGVKLLQRTTRSISLTSDGELFYARAARILDAMREAEDAINQTLAAPRGRLKVSVPCVLGRRMVIPALPAFLDAYPEVELDLWLDDRRVDIVEEGYDLAIRMGVLNDSSLIAHKIAPHRFVTCGAPNYFATHGTPRTPDELAHHPCIRYRFPTTGYPELWAFKDVVGKVPLGTGSVFNDGEALTAAARAGLGIVQLPAYQVSEDLAAGRLQAILTDYTENRGDICLLWPPGRMVAPRIQVFADFVIHLLAP